MDAGGSGSGKSSTFPEGEGDGLSPTSRPQGPSLAPFTGTPLPAPPRPAPGLIPVFREWAGLTPGLTPTAAAAAATQGTGPAHARRNARVSHGRGQARRRSWEGLLPPAGPWGGGGATLG